MKELNKNQLASVFGGYYFVDTPEYRAWLLNFAPHLFNN
jgi:hypothetical protein